jgi:hypothetical protein
MNDFLVELVWRRAKNSCEYCRVPQEFDDATFEIDHIIARKHHGTPESINVCLSCFYCNSFKGSDIASIDWQSGKLTPLFNPRRQRWTAHFQWNGAILVGRTAIGRVTVELLHINDEYRVNLREGLIQEGHFPPE